MSDWLDIPLGNSRQGAVLEKSQELVTGLKLKGVNRVEIRDAIDHSGLPLPCVLLAPYGRRVDANAGPCGKDEFEIGIVVAAIAASERDVTGKYLGWRFSTIEQIEDKFLNRHFHAELPNSGCVKRIITEPGDEFIEEAVRNNLDASFLVVYWIVQRPRPTT